MAIVFDQIDGVVQAENADGARAPAPAPAGADPGSPNLDIERAVRELVASERRRARLNAD